MATDGTQSVTMNNNRTTLVGQQAATFINLNSPSVAIGQTCTKNTTESQPYTQPYIKFICGI